VTREVLTDQLVQRLHAADAAPVRWKALCEIYEDLLPELWHKAYPRAYPDMGAYHSMKVVAMDSCSAAIKRLGPFSSGFADIAEFWTASHLARFRFPTFFLAPTLATAILHTKPPMDLEWHSIELPFEAALFMLPKGTLVHPQYGNCAYIAYARLKKEEVYQSPLTGHPYSSLNGSFVLMAGCPEGKPLVFHYVFSLNESPIVHLQDLEAFMAGTPDNTVPELAGGTGMGDTDEALIQTAAHYLFGTLLLMLNRPDLVEKGGSLGKKKTKHGTEFWKPNIIGSRYRVQHARTSTGEGTSPRGHWRRGHWRQQVHGPHFSLRKNVWIEPVFVNPE
jgi:hypothetical protein